MQYSKLSNFPFTCSVNSGPFNPSEKGAEAQINAPHDDWKDRHYTLHHSQAVEKELIPQVVSAVEPPYLAALRNTHTSCYEDNILTVLQHHNLWPYHSSTVDKMEFSTRTSTIHFLLTSYSMHSINEYGLMPMPSNLAVSLSYIFFVRTLYY